MNLTQTLVIDASEHIIVDSTQAGASDLYDLATAVSVHPPTLINYGRVDFTTSLPGMGVIGVFAPNSLNWTGINVENHGVFHVASLYGEADGLRGESFAPGFINTGQLLVEGATLAFGLERWFPPVDNSGLISVTGSGASTRALDLLGGPVVNSGTILAHTIGSGETVGVDFSFQTTGARLDNSGLIAATDTDPGTSNSVGVSLYGAGSTPFTLVNSGVITGEYAVKETSFVPSLSAVDLITNTGTLNGQVFLGRDNDVLTNSGTINGPADLGVGNDLYDGRLGLANGLVSGGDGADTLLGGAGFDYLQGNAGSDSESGGAGDDWVVGGKGDDILSGDAGGDVMNGNLGSDTLSGGDGGDWIRGGQGDDSLTGGAGDDFMSGDRGNDTMAGGAGADTFNTFAGAGLDRVLDFSLAEGDRVRIEGGVAFTVNEVGPDTVVDLGGGDQIVLAGVHIAASSKDWILLI